MVSSGLLVDDPSKVQAVVQGLADEYSRKILLSAIPEAKSVEDMSRENDIPLSTCYRRVHDLLDAQLLVVQKVIVTNEGKKYELLRSACPTPGPFGPYCPRRCACHRG